MSGLSWVDAKSNAANELISLLSFAEITTLPLPASHQPAARVEGDGALRVFRILANGIEMFNRVKICAHRSFAAATISGSAEIGNSPDIVPRIVLTPALSTSGNHFASDHPSNGLLAVRSRSNDSACPLVSCPFAMDSENHACDLGTGVASLATTR